MLPASSENNDLARLIQKLFDADPVIRTAAAAGIFLRGSELARAATSVWLLDSQLRNCFTLTEAGALKTTVGLAVRRGNFERIRAANSSPRLANVPDDQDTEEFELEFADVVRLDVLTTRHAGAGGAIDRFLEKF